MHKTFIFRSRARGLPSELRLAMARDVKFARMQRFTQLRPEFQQARIDCWQAAARELLLDFIAGAKRPLTNVVPDGPRAEYIEKTDAERYEDRCAALYARNRRALAQLDAMMRRGPKW